MIGRCVALVIGAALLLAAAPAGTDGEAGGFRLRLPLSVDTGARVQRLMLPAGVLAVLQTRDGHDVRVFDARGRAMPIARGTVSGRTHQDTLPPMPILGAPDALKISGVSLRLDGHGTAQVAEVRGEPVTTHEAPVVLGVLLDARRVAGDAIRVSIEADLPVGQPITLAVDASGDLRDWRPLGEVTVYRRAGDPARPAVVPLHDMAVARDHLRITWRAGSRPLTPVAIRRVVLETRPDGAGAVVGIDARAPAAAADSARAIDMAIPFATPIASLRVVPGPDDGVIPVRVLGRDDREQPWALLGQGLAARDPARDIRLTGDTPRIIRIEADARSTGFAEAPRLRIGYAERSLIFLTSGIAPFTLSAGRADARNLFLPAAVLTAGERTLGAARISAAPDRSLDLARPADDGASARGMILWAVLLGATALLAGVAWLLWRQTMRGGGNRRNE